jgi:hypothetical protein
MMTKLYIGGAILLVLVLIVGGFFTERAYHIKRIDSLQKTINEQNIQILEKEKTIALQEGQIESQKLLAESQRIRDTIALEAQIDNRIRTEKRIQEATETKIRETSIRNAEKYTNTVIETLWPNNIELIECLSNLRNIHNETDPCIGRIR